MSTTPATRTVEPLDPDSERGKETAARLSVIFADVRQAIAARKALAAQRASRTNP